MPTRPGRWLHAVGTFAVAVLAWLAYAPVLGAYFRHDDFWWLSTARQWADGTLHLPDPEPGAEIVLAGLPDYLWDVADGLRLSYDHPVQVRVAGSPATPRAYAFSFDPQAPGRLIAFRPPVVHAPPGFRA